MEFRALGPVELWSAGERQDLGSARTRCVLAVLLLSPRAITPATTLIDRLWDSDPPAKARENLSVYVARLRASLRRAVGDRVRLIGRAGGYLLEADPDTVDVHRFRRLCRQAGSLAASGDHGHAARLLREADALWRGEALAGLPGDWAARAREGLAEERRAAISERVGCELEQGLHADLVGELSQLLARYPLDEALIAHQMTALCGSGRRADALRLYRETRRLLVDEQGSEPGPALAELHQRVLGGDPALGAPAAHRAGRAAPPPDTLPPETPGFVGRSTELRVLTGEDAAISGVAVIQGMPGVGKTALAVRAARLVTGRYPDGALYLDLRSHDPASQPLTPAEALRRLLQMLRVPATRIPDSLPERAALWQAQLARRRAVVILDDAGGDDQLRPLLPESGQCLVLVTTRCQFPGSPGARVLPLDVLPVEEAITLFRRIAGDAGPVDAEQVSAAVERCGRLPLAIGLTASRVRRDGPVALSGGTAEPPRSLAPLAAEPPRSLVPWAAEPPRSPAPLAGDGVRPEVLAAFDASYRALGDAERRLFRLLGVSPCAGVSVPAAAALAGVPLAEAERSLAVLTDRHLLARAPGGRYHCHDLLRGYAATRAGDEDPASERRRAIGRLLDYYLGMADAADRLLHPLRHRPPGEPGEPGEPLPGVALAAPDDAAAWLDSEWRDLLWAARAASRGDWPAQGADLVALLGDYLRHKAYWHEAIAAHTCALQTCRELGDPARMARASVALAGVRQETGQHEVARQLAEDAAAMYRSLADRAGEAEALDQVGMAYQRTARSREALAYFAEARILYHAAGDPRGVADTLSHSGIACWHLGRHPEASSHLAEALALYTAAGDRRGEAKALNNLGRIHLYNGRYADALGAYHRSLLIFREIGGAQNEAILLHNIGTVHRCQGSYADGLAACRQALEIYREIGDLPNEADVLNDIGVIYARAACPDEALAHHQRALLIAEEIGELSQRLVALRGIADIRRGAGRYAEALADYHTALRLAREIGDPYEEGKVLEGIAESTLSTPDSARIVFRQALDIFERLGVPEAETARTRVETIDPAFAARVS